MIHFRLRRSVRLAVDFLSLYFAGLSDGLRSEAFVFRESQANASTVFPPPLLATLASPGRPRFAFRVAVLARWLSPAKQVSFRMRRYSALSGLLLAFSLQVCGCNPARDSDLSSDVFASGRTLHEAARGEQNLYFYDPAEPSNGSAAMPLPVSDLLIDTRPAPLEAKPLPWAIPESVYFVYKGRRRDELRPHQPPVATAFVLSVPDRTHNRFVRFLVTARHVVDPQWAHCSERNPASIDVRLNRRTGGVGYETVPLQSGAMRRFFTPPDPTSDLAVIPLDHNLIPNLDDYKFIDIPFRLLPTDSEMHLVQMEQPIMTAGLSPRPSGEVGNYPVFDAGYISKMPTEAVGVQCGIAQLPAKPLHIWFINAGVPQGVSGAPVYTSIVRGSGAMKTPVLLGIQSVAWPDKGIAGITPSSVLGDLVQSALHESKLNMDFYKGPNP